MRKFGLVGYPLGHSFSKGYFTNKFLLENLNDCVYENYPLEKIEFLTEIIQNNPDLVGLNITIPFKQQVSTYLQEIDSEAAQVGAINTIKFIHSNKNTILKGFNTDIYGFEESLKPFINNDSTTALILGTGGASKAVAFVFKKLNISFLFISRKKGNDNVITYDQLTPEIIQTHKIIVNTSPLGMFPNIENFPDIPYKALTKEHLLYDLVYNPEVTVFMKKGAQRGAIVKNGLEMLRLQAEKSWEIWNSD